MSTFIHFGYLDFGFALAQRQHNLAGVSSTDCVACRFSTNSAGRESCSHHRPKAHAA